MRFVLAPDSFKESMTAPEASAAMRRGVLAALPDAECVEVPLSDGGEGFARALTAALGGELVPVTVHDALGRPTTAHLGHVPAQGLAVVEVAEAVGLAAVAPAERDVRAADSRGVGELITAALDLGCRHIVVGLGGSATNDGGAGLLHALGVRFLDDAGAPLEPQPRHLHRLASVDLAGLDPRLGATVIEAATDVTNPLLGPRGASATFGPQKGADPAAVAALDAVLARLASRVAAAGLPGARPGASPGTPPGEPDGASTEAPGAGAAGGIGWALRAVLGARLRSGVELVVEAADLAGAVAKSDWVFTGEGSIDAQTAMGKAPVGVARVAAAAGVPAVAFGGQVHADAGPALAGHFLALVPIVPGVSDLPTALAQGPANLERAVTMVCRLLTTPQRPAPR
ncbi:glycerate kinase [Georgenia faecalis]|uniref:Glycerate kinase n=1 Tax=Georgenia faecalis TaxID=2483799 RepID=A0ABV9D6H6_9MICO|nr:glycerate kinase [Georgenia faecalis]